MRNFETEFMEMIKEAAKPLTPEQLHSKKQNEITLFKSFKADPTPATFQPLYASYKPVIYAAAMKNMRGSQVPQAAHMALAAQSFYDALKTFDPSKGGLSTHVYGYVENRGKRLNYKYMNIGYIPEKRITKYQYYL